VCVLEESILKGINDEIGIPSFTELFDKIIVKKCDITTLHSDKTIVKKCVITTLHFYNVNVMIRTVFVSCIALIFMCQLRG
jgi:hypothetical protein